MKKLVLAALFVAVSVPAVPAAQARSLCDPWNPLNPKCWVRRGDAAVITGSGTISPGLGPVPAAQSVSFTGTATVVGTDGILATYGCSFSGTDLAGSLLEGVGTVSGACGPLAFNTCVFLRIAAEVQVVCADVTVDPGAPSAAVGAGVCVFVPTSSNPVTTYDLICAAAAVASGAG